MENTNKINKNDQIEILKFNREPLENSKILTIKKLNVSKDIDKIMGLQKSIFSMLIKSNHCDFIANRDKEMYLNSNKILFGIFDGEKLIGQAGLGLSQVNKFPKNKKIAKLLGNVGYEMGGVMVLPEYAGNQLCEQLIKFGSNLIKEKAGDFMLYNVQYKNLASIIPALRQNGAFIGECSEASVDEYFKFYGQKPCEEQRGMIIKDVSVFIPLKQQNIGNALNSKEESSNQNQNFAEIENFATIKQLLESDLCFILIGEGEKKKIISKSISISKTPIEKPIIGEHTERVVNGKNTVQLFQN